MTFIGGSILDADGGSLLNACLQCGLVTNVEERLEV
jgi:hypothetical protein